MVMQTASTPCKSAFALSSAGRGPVSRRAMSLIPRAKASNKRGPLGFVEEDNSGRSNIFAVEPKTLYVSSPRSDRASQQGLGGQQGLILVGGLIFLVLLITLGVARTPGENLADVAGNLGGASLSSIAELLK